MPEIRILMVDDHGLFREGLGRLLNATPGFRVVAQCSTLQQATAAIATQPVDVVLLDYDLGEHAGTDLLPLLHSQPVPQPNQLNQPRVLMVTAGLTDAVTVQVLQAGVAGVFLKHSNPDQLVLAIQQVAKGELWLDKGSVQSLLLRNSASRTAQPATTLTHQLTLRQSEVLHGILDGLANKEIAWQLKCSESAVKAVIQELFHKAGVRTRSQLVRIAIEKHSADWLR